MLHVLTRRFPQEGVVCAFAYGSGVFQQLSEEDGGHEALPPSVDRGGAGISAKSPGLPSSGNALVDLIFVVDDAVEWHSKNMRRFPQHYFAPMRWAGPRAVACFQESMGGGHVYFNTDVGILDSRSREVRVKYGVISKRDLVHDLVNWDVLYIAGRLHKPVRFTISPSNDLELQGALRTNLRHAMHAALLLLPERFTEFQLFETICSLSYFGDIRMRVAENPNKAGNIVRGSFPHFQKLYAPYLQTRPQSLEATSEQDPAFLGEVQRSNESEFVQNKARDLQAELFNSLPIPRLSAPSLKRGTEQDFGGAIRLHLAKTVHQSSRIQTAKGLLTAGPHTALVYGLRKLAKRFL